jgi:glucose dehydrogenase
MRARILFACAVSLTAVSVAAATVAETDWPVYGGALANTHYTPLNQINTSNVSQLVEA